MYKVKNSDKTITPYGGLNLVFNAITAAGIDKFIDEILGYRSISAKYKRSDIVLSLLGMSMAQGSFLSDIEVFKSKFIEQVFNKIPSADTVEYVCDELKVPTIVHHSTNGILHEFNYNQDLNNALVALAVKTKQLPSTIKHILDFDNVVVATQKQDAKMSYKQELGYHPNIAFIGRLPVHIECHNGNTPARYQQLETLTRCFDNLDKNGVKIEYFRADSASCQADVLEMVAKRGKYFYVRMVESETLRESYTEIDYWETVEINNRNLEVSEIYYKMPKCKTAYRIVVTRHLRKDGQVDLLTQSPYTYQGIVTNDAQKCRKDVIEFYNQRGDSEKSNCYLLNDYNLNHLPFSDMDKNTVYMYLMAMCSIIFEWTKIILVENKVPKINVAMRTKAICFNYIMVAATIIKHAGQKIIQFFSSPIEYDILKI